MLQDPATHLTGAIGEPHDIAAWLDVHGQTAVNVQVERDRCSAVQGVIGRIWHDKTGYASRRVVARGASSYRTAKHGQAQCNWSLAEAMPDSHIAMCRNSHVTRAGGVLHSSQVRPATDLHRGRCHRL